MTTALVRLRESQLAQKVMVKIKNYTQLVYKLQCECCDGETISMMIDGNKDRLNYDANFNVNTHAHEIKC